MATLGIKYQYYALNIEIPETWPQHKLLLLTELGTFGVPDQSILQQPLPGSQIPTPPFPLPQAAYAHYNSYMWIKIHKSCKALVQLINLNYEVQNRPVVNISLLIIICWIGHNCFPA